MSKIEVKVEKVIKRDGRIVDFDVTRIENAIRKAMLATNSYNKEVLEKVISYIILIINEKYKEKYPHVEEIQDIVEFSLMKYGLFETAKAYVLYRKERERIREEKKKILQKSEVDEVDKNFSINALRILASRYLLRDEEGKIIESPKQLFQRVAALIVIPDILYDSRIFDKNGLQKIHDKEDFNPEEYEFKIGLKEIKWNRWHLERMKNLYDELNSQGKMKVSWKKFLEMLSNGEFDNYYEKFMEYYRIMVEKKFMPNSPTLFNAGARLGQLSACFVLDIDDNIESIMETVKEASIIFKTGGGVGINYSKLRPEGDVVASTSGTASGPCSFMRIIDVTTDVIKQGGCLSSDSYIRTDKGLKQINQFPIINPRDDYPLNIFIYSGKDFEHAFLGSLNGKSEVYRISTELGNYVDVTYDELVSTLDEEGNINFKEAIKLKPGDWVVISLGGLQGKEKKLPEVNIQHFNANKLRIPNVIDKDFSEILGFYMAEGCFNNGRFILTFSNKKIEEYFIKKIEKVFGLKPGEKRENKNYTDVIWYSRDLERYFEKLGFKKENSSKAFIPQIIMESEKEIVCAFLKGLFEGDGGVSSYGYPTLTTTSEKLAYQVQQLLLSLNIVSKISKKKASDIKGHMGKNNVYYLRIIDSFSINNFISQIGFISKNKNSKIIKRKKYEKNFILPNQEKKLIKIYEKIKEENKKLASNFYRKIHKYMLGYRNLTLYALKRISEEFPILKEEFKEILEGKYYFAKISSISKTRKDTFHLEVSPSGQFVANGIIIHNKRRGANMGILNASHPEIEKFITLKSTEGVLENFNISVALNKDFWDAYEKDEPYFLINPRNGKSVKKIDPKHLLEIIALSAWKTADPGVLFLDNINKRNILKKARGEITATNPCVVGDTLISTEYGLMRMKDLVKKYPNGGIKIAIDNRVPIQIMNPDGTISLMQTMQKGVNFNTISRAFCTGLKEVYKLITKSGYELIATPDHKVLTNKGWVRIIDLKPLEHKVLIQSGEGKFNNNYQLPFNVKNEYKGRNGRLYKLNLPTKWSKELGQVLGWLIGDGWLKNGKNCRVEFTFSKEDKKILEYFKSIINKWYNYNIKEVKRKNGVYHLSYHSKYFVDFFKKLGVKSVNAKEKVVPESIFIAPKEAVIGFLQGLFTADGTIGYDENNGNYYIRLTSKSKKLLKDVQILLLNLGIKTKIYDRSRKPRKIFPYKNKNGKIKYYKVDGECYELHISKEDIKNFINKIGFLLNKYHNKIKKLKMKDFYETIFEDEILLIEPCGKEYVYDLTEPKTFSFISNGIISLDCGEQPLYPYESCNLGSINLYAFIKRDIEGNVEFDWKELEKTIRIAIDFLDNVIDVNKYPLKKIEERTKESRKIGLGMMGLADTLFALKIPYNSEEGFEFMRKIAEFIDYHAYIRSIERAKERGAFPLFEKSGYVDGEMPVEGFYHKNIWNFDWDKIIEMIKKYGVRNSNLTSIAPTGTISMIVDASSGLEPQFALIYEKTVTIGKFYYVNQELEIQLRERGLYNEKIIEKIAENGGSIQEIDGIPEDLKKVFVTAYDIPWWDHIRAQYEIGLWVDAGISKTINMANWVSVEDVKNAYLFAYKLGLKGITIYRDGSKTKQVLTTPTQRRGKYLKIVENKTIDMLNKYGIKATIEEKEEKINSLPFLKMDIPKFNLLPKEVKKKAKREVCPMCQSQSLVYHESCVTCMNCGWSECVEA